MIKHHPPQAMIEEYVAGELSAPLAAAVAIHLEMCPECQHIAAQCTAKQANCAWEQDTQVLLDDDSSVEFDTTMASLIERITDDNDTYQLTTCADLSVEIKSDQYQLPRTLNSINIHKFNGFGKISRAKIDLDDEQLHTHLLHMEPTGEVPKHTHKGFELTLLLSGSFSDDFGDYHPGDFILLDSEHHHQPRSAEGCLCYTVVSEPLKFTEGLSQLLNPIGKYIY